MIKLPMREKFLERVYKEKCTFQLDHEEVNDVENKTLQILRDILDNVGRANPAFKIWEIIKSGSFYEGTKVGPPDEFDFMIVFENLSRKESIELETGCTPWFQKIKVVDADVKTIYNKYLTHKKEYLGETSKMVYDFWKQLLSVLKEKPFSIETRKGKITAIPNHKQKLLLKYVGSCMLSPSDNSHGLVPKDSIEIGIDLMPAIKHPNVSTVMSYSGFPKQFQCDLQETGCHIIAKSCHKDHFPDPPCWFITLAAIELKTMQNMDEKHKKAYKVLKSLVIGEINYPGKCINLSSYMLKTALMFHVHGDVQCSGTHFGDCIENILSYLGSNFFNLRMPCFFARDMDTWGILFETPGFNWEFDRQLTVIGDKIGGGDVLYALLWLYFWYKSTEAAKSLLAEESCVNEHYSKITHRFELFKASVRFFLGEYYSSGKVWKVQLKRSRIRVNSMTSAKVNIGDGFPFYMQKLKEEYGMNEDII